MFPNLRLPRNLPSAPTWSRQYSRVNHGLMQIALVEPLIVLSSLLSRCFSRKQQDKVLKAVARGQVGSDHGWLVVLSRPVVLERMSQVWRRSEVGNHKRRSLNTRLSSSTSANTSCRCVFLCFVDPILGNLTVRGHSLSQGTWGCRILTLHLNYVAGYTGHEMHQAELSGYLTLPRYHTERYLRV